MVNFCLKEEEKNLLRSLIGKKLIKYRHDPLDKFGNKEIALQGDYMIPLVDIFKGENAREKLAAPGNEFNQPGTKFNVTRDFVKIN